ncbi:MAG: chlorophyll synthase ChlG [Chloroflexota bacterium]
MVTTDTRATAQQQAPAKDWRSSFSLSIKLMKPLTWFAPTWAFFCGAIASGAIIWNVTSGAFWWDMFRMALGMVMAGPILCGVSQVVNDYFDREIDAINEPDRLIPSGKISTQQIIVTVVTLMTVGFAIGLFLGHGVRALVLAGLFAGIAYSAPPIRAKRNGWYGNTLVAISYEGMAWLAGHLAFAALTPQSFIIAALYSLGTHGIMSINDYKGVEGDRASGIRTIPVQLGREKAAWLIVATMNVAQLGVVLCLWLWGQWLAALVIGVFIIIQLPLQQRFIADPAENFIKFSAFGVTIFVWGMLVAAIGLGAMAG